MALSRLREEQIARAATRSARHVGRAHGDGGVVEARAADKLAGARDQLVGCGAPSEVDDAPDWSTEACNTAKARLVASWAAARERSFCSRACGRSAPEPTHGGTNGADERNVAGGRAGGCATGRQRLSQNGYGCATQHK